MTDAGPTASLWRDRDFLKLWLARTLTTFGTLMGALQLTAILVVEAEAFQVALLGAFSYAPGLAFGLFVGVWIDRVRRRPVLVAADLTRALLLASVPIAFFAGQLTIYQLYAVGFGVSSLRVFFDVAHHSYVPSVVGEKRLVEANSKLSASNSVVEVMGFSVGGWIAQLASAIVAVIVDAGMFFVSGMLLLAIRKREAAATSSGPTHVRTSVRRELMDGLRHVWSDRVLRAIFGSHLLFGIGSGMIGGTITVFGIRELGFGAGVLGTIYAAGGISSFAGALLAGRVTRRIGLGPAMILGLVAYGAITYLIPLARGPLYIAAIFMTVPQLLGDGLWTLHDIAELSLRQAITPDRLRGRVNSAMLFGSLGGSVAGSLIASAVVGPIGLRWTLAAGAAMAILAGLTLLASPIRRIRGTPEPVAAKATGAVAPRVISSGT